MIETLLIALTRFLVGGQARWTGAGPEPRQRIYFANHASHLDTLLIWSALPRPLRASTHPIAAADYWGSGNIRRHIALKVLNAVLVERSAKGPPGAALAPLRGVLSEGGSLILFPEGTRGSERLPGPFKSGLYWLAQDFPDAELIPTYLDNPSRAFPKGAFLPVPISCTVRFGAPLARRQGEEKDEFLERARQAVSALASDAIA
ncbi:lysophospholipid acyltransferase family protein [Sinorhizobium alkalisoli]|uniref:lysophospholipid acyltransferase family protein n=1 Tax=Sinorhizobium alkalisoli TaxID=1752398 RepID=UPI00124F3311|nr:lysophospholipid acyltransferase family protein [Sinorhizobium alkalisoli]MCA1491111.1 1-acyl-sn-glycerol-3-phosphate acyltransferase [Ensifer sp. NBAIM29]MCG5477505.1 1-acyl-sn-glycerol-3-phosphate acyltransferase [Sinorhizobium alkalisoli]QFI64984.1 1-acyl-sn-glycerol-3-phosphate acyltransferase [Sinorhizobium alkalisoli]